MPCFAAGKRVCRLRNRLPAGKPFHEGVGLFIFRGSKEADADVDAEGKSHAQTGLQQGLRFPEHGQRQAEGRKQIVETVAEARQHGGQRAATVAPTPEKAQYERYEGSCGDDVGSNPGYVEEGADSQDPIPSQAPGQGIPPPI